MLGRADHGLAAHIERRVDDHRAAVFLVELLDCPVIHRVVIFNTSFNVRGEPIVGTPEHAYLCFMRTNMDFLLVGNFLLEKKDQKPLDKDINWLKEFELD